MIPVRGRTTEGMSRERLRLEGKRSLRPLLLFAAFAIVAIVSGGLILKNLGVQWPWQDPFEFQVAVHDASGVVAGEQEVTVAGVPAGTIVDSRLVDGRAVLSVSLDRGHAPLHRDARVRLRPRTPLQDMYLNIESRGTPTAGELEEGETLSAERTRTAVHINRVLDVFQPATRRRLEQMVDNLGQGLGDDGHQLRETFVELAPFVEAAAQLTAESAKRRRITRRLVRNARLLFDELAQRDRQLTGLASAGSATLGEVARNREPFARFLSELPPTLRQVRGSFTTLRGALDEVDPALSALQGPAEQLDPGLEAMSDFGQAARPALAALRPAVRELVPTARVLDPVSRDLASAFEHLQPAAPRLDRITAAVVPCELAVQKFFQNTISVFKFGDANGAYPRGELTVGLDSVGAEDPNLRRGRSCTDGEGQGP